MCSFSGDMAGKVSGIVLVMMAVIYGWSGISYYFIGKKTATKR